MPTVRSDVKPTAGVARGADTKSTPHSEARDPATVPEASPKLARYQMAITMLRWLLVVLFLIVGVAKLIAVPSAVALFDEVGVGQWFRYVVGGGEVVGALLLARVPTALAGVMVLGFLMIGAAGTEVFILHRLPVSSGFTLIGVAILARALR